MIDPLDREVLIAEAIARLMHHGQRTKSENWPYITHVKRVAEAVLQSAKATAWLHDVLEDTPITANQLDSAGISPDTIVAVKLLTRAKAPAGATRKWRQGQYEKYITQIVQSGNWRAIAVKQADLRDNLRASCPDSLRKRYEAALEQFHDANLQQV